MQIISSPKTLNAILESGFIQNTLFGGAPYSTQFDPNKSTGQVVVYLELYEIDLERIKQIKASGKKVVLYHMGDELADLLDHDLAGHLARGMAAQAIGDHEQAKIRFHEEIVFVVLANAPDFRPSRCRNPHFNPF